ncbi:hypothetical protein CEXT_725371 [Caerostris extrusa]|uniref:Uncharacterized protein n=1 Tax=Caerostris extrusa TaxID=172846 RepID=A0AAV4XNQ9_CAEEX|nr:hypothetical protein CEXT_725371 [Caerostris extrusa]
MYHVRTKLSHESLWWVSVASGELNILVARAKLALMRIYGKSLEGLSLSKSIFDYLNKSTFAISGLFTWPRRRKYGDTCSGLVIGNRSRNAELKLRVFTTNL